MPKVSTITKEQLQDLYDRLTDCEIASQLGISEPAVCMLRKRRGVITKSARQRQEASVDAPQGTTNPSLDTLTTSVLQDLYQKMGDRQIAKLYGVDKPVIARLRRKFGIAAISKSERALCQETLTEEQKQIVLGTLLGDGFLFERGVLKVTHSHAQFGYLSWMHSKLGNLALPIFFEEKEMLATGATKYAFGFRTAMSAWLRDLHSVYYPQGRKVFPTEILANLEPLSLACWYFDDGNWGSGSLYFALGDISVAEAEQVASLVGARFNLDTAIKPSSANSNCKLLSIKAASWPVFFQLVAPFATADMLYKIPQALWPKGVVPIRASASKTTTKLPTALLDQSKLWASLQDSEKEAHLDSLSEHWKQVGFPYPQADPSDIDTLIKVQWDQVIADGCVKAWQAGQSACIAQHPHFWAAHTYGAKRTVKQLFDDDSYLRKVLRRILDSGKIPNAGQLRTGLQTSLAGVYNFRPTAAKALVDLYGKKGGVVYDPCAGWGGRLFGAVLSNTASRYVACEPSTQTYAGLQAFTAWVDQFVPGCASRVELHNLPAEDFEPPKADLVLTSPPYWKREIYADETTQSSVRYPSYAEWLSGFWAKVLHRAIACLNPGGCLLLNVDDFEVDGVRYFLIQDTIDLCMSFGLGQPERLAYSMPSFVKQNNQEALLCWRLPTQQIVHPESGLQLVLTSCHQCARPTPATLLEQGLCFVCRTPAGKEVACKGCSTKFWASRPTACFCGDTCYARWRREQRRLTNPPKQTRVFECLVCGKEWETALKGHFTKCDACKEDQAVAKRTKVCQYRLCGRSFQDTSKQNNMSYCCPEHREREKRFVLGLITDISQFRKPDPVLQAGLPLQHTTTCRSCKNTFTQPVVESRQTRCPACKEGARQKVCRGCGLGYSDSSENNTRRYCEACKPV